MVSHHVPLPLIISLSFPHSGIVLVIPLFFITTSFPLIGSIIIAIPLSVPLVISFVVI
jgi:hypothetical protein